MFSVRRIFRCEKPLTNYIYTSNVLRSDESKKSKRNSYVQKKKEKKTPEGKLQPEMNIFSAPEEKLKIEIPKSAETESDLLNKLSEDSEAKEVEGPKQKSKIQLEHPGKPETVKQIRKDVFKMFQSSVDEVAKELGGNKKQTKKDLLGYLTQLEVTKEAEVEKKWEVRSERRQRSGDADSSDAPMAARRAEFANWPTLQIFDWRKMQTTEEKVKLNIWDSLEAEHLNYLAQKPPRNHFEELIQWTREGKLWHFPIDNDQGREEEANVDFTEHVFLEKYLERWCPKKGPLRRFMDLVLIGLSKNYHLTVEEKKEHIEWFEKYFDGKKKLLQELGAMGAPKKIQEPTTEEKSSASS